MRELIRPCSRLSATLPLVPAAPPDQLDAVLCPGPPSSLTNS